jgi:hypothetical protein
MRRTYRITAWVLIISMPAIGCSAIRSKYKRAPSGVRQLVLRTNEPGVSYTVRDMSDGRIVADRNSSEGNTLTLDYLQRGRYRVVIRSSKFDTQRHDVKVRDGRITVLKFDARQAHRNRRFAKDVGEFVTGAIVVTAYAGLLLLAASADDDDDGDSWDDDDC